ncbi:MAG: nitroreductase family protein [Eubacteriales bacterium]
MNATEMVTGRRSIRKYKEELVSREDIQAIMEETRYTQSWGNMQVARFTFVQDPTTIEKLAHDGVKGFVYNVDTLKNAKNVLVLSFVEGKSGKLDETGYATSKENIWEVFDSGIACQTFALVAHAHGVGTCVMGVIDDKKIAEIVNLPKEETVAAMITFGYPDEKGNPTTRLSVEELCHFL